MSEQLSMQRLGRLIWADFLSRYRTVAIVSAIFVLLMLIHGINAASSTAPQTNIFVFWVFAMLFVWGPIAASAAFKELHDKTKNEAYLLLPASALEKTLSRLLLVTVALGVYSIVLANVASWLSAAANWLVLGRSGLLFPLFATEGWLGIAVFIVHQSIYFLGAAWFRKSHFTKTALVLMFGSVGLVILAAVVARILVPGLDGGFDPDPNLDIDGAALFRRLAGTVDALAGPAKVFCFGVVPIFCVFVAWLRVRETQVSHGI